MPDPPVTVASLHARAAVPEHSAAFMHAMSGGRVFTREGFVFAAAEDWLLAVGYPLNAVAPAADTGPGAFYRTLEAVAEQTGARDIWAIAPELPPELLPHRDETDWYYTLPTDAPTPSRLQNPIAKARQHLRITEGREFTAAHRRLWAEFLRRKTLTPQVRELFARVPFILGAPGTDIRLCNALDAAGNLAACLVLDYAPEEFCAYLVGAHSREAYTPHASDALFAAMLASARGEGKKYIHLGLGVNEGIRRFKTKWGGVAALPYQAASWTRNPSAPAARCGPDTGHGTASFSDAVCLSLLTPGSEKPPRVGENILFGKPLPPEQRPYAMLWQVSKNNATSWIGGTAHAFRYSFAASFKKLFREVDTVIFEGPLDAASLAAFSRHGRTRDTSCPCLLDHLTAAQVRHLEAVVNGPRGKLAAFLNMTCKHPCEVRKVLATYRPWSVFFSLYYAFLERHGWVSSVDLEAWEIAHEMGRTVIGMESVAEQIASLESVPLERIISFLQRPEDWNRRMRQSLAAYLDGDLQRLLDTGTEFPTRTATVIGARDQRFRERMRPYLEQGRTAVFVGSAHMCNLEKMLREDGFTLTRVLPSWKHRLKAALRRKPPLRTPEAS